MSARRPLDQVHGSGAFDANAPTEEVASTGSSPPTKLGCIDVFLGVSFIAVAVYTIVLLPFAPSQLGTHTILWEALRGSTASIVTGGALVHAGRASGLGVVLAGLVGTIDFDWLYWWGGGRWGQWWIAMLIEGKPRTARVMARIQGLMAGGWATPILLISHIPPVPGVLVFVAAGWSGMSLGRFLVLDVVAGLLRIGLLGALGYAIGHPAIQVTKEISHYGLVLGILIVLVIIGQMMWQARSRG
ncbi:MAG: DedA family protein [Solirubrobacteraceae bacterium]